MSQSELTEDPITSTVEGAIRAARTAIGVSGIVTLLVGVAILVWPGRSAQVLVGLLAVYAVIAGLAYLAASVFGRGQSGWARGGSAVRGAFFIGIGIFAFANLAAATSVFAGTLGLLLGIAWIIEGVLELFFRDRAPARGWAVAFAVLSIVAGVILLFSPQLIAVLWIWLGILAIIVGIAQIVHAFQFGRGLL